MPIINRIAEFHEDMKEWRQHLHSIPELTFDCHKTSAFVIERLREFGVDEIHEGIAKTGLVAIINGQGEGPTIGLRADMDALPITEIRDHAYKSQNPGKMHACGHDGHTTMLLGAARYLAETRNFKGRVALIFQPAEEGGGGGEVMCKEGIMNRFDIAQVYGVHNAPNIPLGNFLANSGPVMAAADSFEIRIAGRGGHGASPEETIDPVMVAVNIVQMLQTITSRNINALDNLVISVTQIHTGTIDNIIPSDAFINGTHLRQPAEYRSVGRTLSQRRILARGRSLLQGRIHPRGQAVQRRTVLQERTVLQGGWAPQRRAFPQGKLQTSALMELLRGHSSSVHLPTHQTALYRESAARCQTRSLPPNAANSLSAAHLIQRR